MSPSTPLCPPSIRHPWWGRAFVVGVLCLILWVPITTQYFIFVPWLAFHMNRPLWLYLGPFNLGIASILLNYYLGVTTDAGRVPADYEPPPAVNVKGSIKPRWCKGCKVFKPPRSHHCSVCNRCILKMDHHCPFLNNCIGHANQGYFLRFLWSVTTTAIYCLCLLGLRVWDLAYYQNLLQASYESYDPTRPTVDFYTPPPEGPEVVFLIINLIVLALLLLTVGILSGYQLYYASAGITTIESFENEKIADLVRAGKLAQEDVPPYPYDLGSRLLNVQQVLGRRWWLWAIPQRADGSGVSFPVNEATRVRMEKLGGAALQWPPQAYFTYRRYPHGRRRGDGLSRRERADEARMAGEARAAAPRVRRGSEGFLVREWTAEDREKEVERAMQREEWTRTHKPLVVIEGMPDARLRTAQADDGGSTESDIDSDDDHSSVYFDESTSGDDGDLIDGEDGDHVTDSDDEVIGLRNRKIAEVAGRRSEPALYTDDGAVEVGCTGPATKHVKKGLGV
ncbi:Palmitoyltransferase [Geranomyces michiganensis]|nr:Palmitoyltransferase [Geranomyces michiganensis]